MGSTGLKGVSRRLFLAAAVVALFAMQVHGAAQNKPSGIKDARGQKLKDCINRGAEAVHGPDWKTKAKTQIENRANVQVAADPERGYKGETFPPAGARSKNQDADVDDAIDIAVQQTSDTVSDYEVEEMCKLTDPDSDTMKAVKAGKDNKRTRPTRNARRLVSEGLLPSTRRPPLAHTNGPMSVRLPRRNLLAGAATVCNATKAVANGELCESQDPNYDPVSGHGGAANLFRNNGWWPNDDQLVAQDKLAVNVAGCIAAESVVIAADAACNVMVGVWPEIFTQDAAKAACEAATYALSIFATVCHAIEDQADIINDGIAGGEAVTIYENSIGVVVNQQVLKNVIDATNVLSSDTSTRTGNLKTRSDSLIATATAVEGTQDTITGTTLPAAKAAIRKTIQDFDEELTSDGPGPAQKGRLVVLEAAVQEATSTVVSSAQAAAGETAAAFAFVEAQLTNTTGELTSAAQLLQADIAAADAAIKAMLCKVQDTLALLEKEIAYQRQLLLTAEPSRPAWDGGSFQPLYWIPCANPTTAPNSTICSSSVPRTLAQQAPSYTCASLLTGYVN